MNKNQSAIRVYPMKKRFQYVNKIAGHWMYFFGTMLFVERSLITLIPWNFLRNFFLWGTGSLEWYFALRKMREGEARSYLQISEDGLAYYNHPFFEIRCKWEDVKSIKKGGFFGDVLRVKRAEISSVFTIVGEPQIHLSSLTGWAEGRIQDDLRRYAPQLFET